MRLGLCGVDGPIATGLREQLAELELGLSSLSVFSLAPIEEGASVRFEGRTVPVMALSDLDFSELDLLVMLEPHPEMAELADNANAMGCHVIDASMAPAGGRWVVPELMLDERVDYPVYWALPYAALSALAPVLEGLLAGNELLTVDALICESASAYGDIGTRQLAAETARLLNGQGIEGDGPQLAFNLLPDSLENAEVMEQGLQDLLGVRLSACRLDRAQMPLFYGQATHLTATLAQPLMLDSCIAAWRESGIHVFESKEGFSTVALAEDDRIHLGGLQPGRSDDHTLRAWIIADNIRKGAVVNITRLIEILIKSSI